MKKILAGCLIVAVIAIIGFSVAGYYAFRVLIFKAGVFEPIMNFKP